jgi:hypothetical protein
MIYGLIFPKKPVSLSLGNEDFSTTRADQASQLNTSRTTATEIAEAFLQANDFFTGQQ